MLKSQILEKLHKKHSNLSFQDINDLFDIFVKKISNSLRNGQNIEIRGFGTISRKINKEKISFKLHFKIGKVLHRKINGFTATRVEDEV